MNELEASKELDNIASDLIKLKQRIYNLGPQLKLNMDIKVATEIVTDLTWAAENCSVISNHLMGECLDDNMGTGLKD